MKRSPMSRGTGFKRRLLPARQSTTAEGVRALAVATRRGIYAAPAQGVAMPKAEQHRNAHLLSMARGQPCMLEVPGICNGDRTTVVAAHSNLSIHGKAGARKADDQYHVYACFACHQWLDQGGAPAEIKACAFMQAHLWMVDIWRGIVAGFIDATPKDKAAAQWALARLNATPVGQGDSP
ncbi:Protein of unknown function [Variovorax sp. YR634]|uniref:nuclease domain-containing protein n=1 Tax=Variovorax sp. YR634 TaxID=1884385 RepID=UPI00089B5CA5|nr:nuclease domain-containing protein [Variovorax sp. YR634]SDX13782.1 Protein of unknown function [Variovorax sp. YR634]